MSFSAGRVTGMIAGSITFRPSRGGSSRICAVSCMLYRMVRKHHSTAIIQEQLQPPRIWPLSLDGLPVAYPGTFAQLRCQSSSRISAGAGVGRGSLNNRQ